MIKEIFPFRHFYQYQKERFPLGVLTASLLPAILSSGAVTIGAAPVSFTAAALLASIAYLLHVRVLDDYRDYEHDRIYHPERPFASGRITRRELATIDRTSIIILILIALLHGPYAILFASLMLGYSFLAGKDFYAGARLRRHFFFYNFINMAQVILLQVLVYALANPAFQVTKLVLLHFCFTASGSLIVEFLRKIKIPGADGTGKDTYTWHLGFGTSLAVYGAMLAVNVALFFTLAGSMPDPWKNWAIAAALVSVTAAASLGINFWRRATLTNRVMQGAFVFSYAAFNIIIFMGR